VERQGQSRYADDLAELIEHRDLRDAVLVGHSTGGGEVARYIGRHGTQRVKKAVLIAAVPPLMLKTPANPGGLPLSVFDDIRKGVLENRSQFFKDLALPFYGFNRRDATPSQGTVDAFWYAGMQCSIKSAYDCVKAFSETDFTDDLRKRPPGRVLVRPLSPKGDQPPAYRLQKLRGPTQLPAATVTRAVDAPAALLPCWLPPYPCAAVCCASCSAATFASAA
jgi:pimeloyl-ACP methyl ester carboxylesterase